MSEECEIVLDILNDIRDFILLIESRMSSVSGFEDFLENDDAIMRFDSIMMRLQAIGEMAKALFGKYEGIVKSDYDSEWAGIIKMRDKISHHYLDMDAEIVYDVCVNHLPNLLRNVDRMIIKYKEG